MSIRKRKIRHINVKKEMTTSDRKADLGMRLDMGPGNADMHEWE